MTAPSSTAVIRQWARDNGLPVGERGRLSPQLLTAYASSGPSAPGGNERTLASPPYRAPRRRVAHAVRIPVQPTPGATGIAHKIAARTS